MPAKNKVDFIFTMFDSDVLDRLCMLKLPNYESRAMLFIIRKTWGFNKIWDRISVSQFVKYTNIERRNISKALISLESKRIIIVSRDTPKSIRYSIQRDWGKWKVSYDHTTPVNCVSTDDKLSSQETTKSLSQETHTIDNINYTKERESATHEEPQKPKQLKDWKPRLNEIPITAESVRKAKEKAFKNSTMAKSAPKTQVDPVHNQKNVEMNNSPEYQAKLQKEQQRQLKALREDMAREKKE